MHRWKAAWESARKAANVSCRFHDLRHTFISRLAESQASDSTVMALAGHVSRAMMERYSHIRMEAKRRAVEDLSGKDFEPGSCGDAQRGDWRSPQVLQYALLGSDRRQLALEGPATVVFRDSD